MPAAAMIDALAVLPFAFAAAAPVEFEVGRGPPAWPAPPASYPGGVSATGDIIYAQPLHYRPLRLDLYRPHPDGRPKPLIVHVHGGAWLTGTKRQGGPIKDFPAVLAQIAERGFVVASVEYRLDGEAKFPAAIQDVKAAIGFLRVHASEFGIDPAHVGIFGGSAGGQLAALATTSCGVKAFDAVTKPGVPPPPSNCVQAGVSWYGVHNFATTPTPPGNTGPQPYLGCREFQCPAETMAFASPQTYVDRGDPPMLLIHGLADKLVAVSQTEEFEAALKKARVPVQAIYIAGVDHGFVGKSDTDTHAAVLQALTVTVEFFERELGQSKR